MLHCLEMTDFLSFKRVYGVHLQTQMVGCNLNDFTLFISLLFLGKKPVKMM